MTTELFSKERLSAFSAEQIEFFETEGYLVLDDVYDEALVARTCGEIHARIDVYLQEESDGTVDRFENEPFQTRLARIAEQDLDLASRVLARLTGGGGGEHTGPAILDFIRCERLLEYMQDLVGETIIGSSVYRIRPKLPNYGRGVVPWHQDSGYLLRHCDSELIVTCWIPLVDADSENGCLQVLPRCHKRGILEHRTGGPAGFLIIPDEALPKDVEPVTVPVKRGGVLLMTDMTPHCSTPNTTEHIRWSVDLRYQSAAVPNDIKPPIAPPVQAAAEAASEGVEVACHPPEADFIIRDPAHPDREVTDVEALRRIRAGLSYGDVPDALRHKWVPAEENIER